jgi:hypothetical protein
VPGGTTAQQPKYAATTATLTDNVGVALKAVTYTSIKLTVPRILQLGSWAQSQYIKKISLPGLNKKGYFFLMHPMDFDALLDPSVSGSFQAYWITGAALQDTAKLIQSQVGMIGDILCVRDERAPTATLAGSASSYALTFGYLMMGRVDTRATGTTANTHFNINSLLGENALAKFEAEAMHYEDQLDEYKQFKNVGIFGTDSYQIPKFDIDTGTDTSMQQESSIIVPTQRA